MREKNPEEELKEAFRVFDAEGTGVIGHFDDDISLDFCCLILDIFLSNSAKTYPNIIKTIFRGGGAAVNSVPASSIFGQVSDANDGDARDDDVDDCKC